MHDIVKTSRYCQCLPVHCYALLVFRLSYDIMVCFLDMICEQLCSLEYFIDIFKIILYNVLCLI